MKSIVDQHLAIKAQVNDILENREHHVVDYFIKAVIAMNKSSDKELIEIAELAVEKAGEAS